MSIDMTLGGSLWFNQKRRHIELPNVMSIDIDEDVDQDAATCTIKLLNARPRAYGSPVGLYEDNTADAKGWYTFSRGTQGPLNRWKHTRNGWEGLLVENRVIRTYQGYGIDRTKRPHRDPNVMITGTWLIDDVILGSDKTITLKCRDAAKVLIEEHSFPPVIPLKHYPLSFSSRAAAKEKDSG